jgi:hypothetical protein
MSEFMEGFKQVSERSCKSLQSNLGWDMIIKNGEILAN